MKEGHLRLAATLAARKFARHRARGETRAPRTSWNPLGLRWRRSARPIAQRVAGSRSPSPVVSNAWLPQFHLHFAATEKVSDRRWQFSSQAPRVTAIIWRQLRERLLPGRTRAPGERPIAGHAPSLRLGGEGQAPRDSTSRNVQTVIAAQGAQGAPLRAEQTFRRIVGAPSQRAVAPVSAGRRSAVDVGTPVRRQVSPVPLQFHTQGPNLQRQRRNEVPEAAVRRASARSSVVPMDRAPELVWRAPAKTSVRTSASDLTERADTSGAVVAAGMASVRATAGTMASPTPENANPRPMALDPALVDRLAEDVIRRVERHVRIERERRGV